MSNYKDWINKIDINIDYYSAFIKAWIAFNAWYRSEYSERQDRAVIEKIKSENNRFKTYINNYLEGNDDISQSFQEYIGKLHNALNNAAIATQERSGTRTQISFTDIAINNPKTTVDVVYRRNRYNIERSNTRTATKITNISTGGDIFSFGQDNYNLDELSVHPDFVKLSEECKAQCIANYRQVNPFITENLLTSDSDKKTFWGTNFVNDSYKISRGIVEVLYLLRCSLMHGELSPDRNSAEVYRYAYEILATVLKKLL